MKTAPSLEHRLLAWALAALLLVWAAFMGESGGKCGILIQKPRPGCGLGL